MGNNAFTASHAPAFAASQQSLFSTAIVDVFLSVALQQPVVVAVTAHHTVLMMNKYRAERTDANLGSSEGWMSGV